MLAAGADQSTEKPYTVRTGRSTRRLSTVGAATRNRACAATVPTGPAVLWAGARGISQAPEQDEFNEVVVNGRSNVNIANTNVMPPFGEVEDVVTYLDDIWAYLKARADGVLGRGRPPGSAIKLSVAAHLVLFGAYSSTVSGPVAAQAGELVDRGALKVCADPNNLPFSDEKKEGLEPGSPS